MLLLYKFIEIKSSNKKIEEEKKIFESQIKELKKRHFQVDNEIEKKSNYLVKLIEENKNLKIKNDELLNETLIQIKYRETNLEKFLHEKESNKNNYTSNGSLSKDSNFKTPEQSSE